jgi:hypothetical protein
MTDPTTTNPPAANTNSTGETTPPAESAPAPVDDGGSGCDLTNGSPSFVDGEGGSPTSTEPGTPVPAAAGLRPTNKEYITNQPLPPIPTNINFNNAARNIKLSHYFTLHDMLHPALGAVSIPMGGKNAAGKRWSAYQIVQNLRDLCVLCLDPIKHRYRNVLITSTFRGDSSGSAHNVGWGCDMQFGAHGKSGGALIDVANDVARIPGLAYDQLLYEYAPTRCRSTWLHIGLRRPSTLEVRSQAQSFYKDKPYGARGRFDQMPGLRR